LSDGYADQQASGGVILMRYPANARTALPGDVVQLCRGSRARSRWPVRGDETGPIPARFQEALIETVRREEG